MTTTPDAIDISLFWIGGPDRPDRSSLTLPDATPCSSLADALDKAKPSEGEARPWIQADGVLFGPAQIDVLRRLTVSPA